MATSRQLFVAATPYHVFLSCGLAMASETARSELVLTPDFDDHAILSAAIEQAHPDLFHRITTLADVRGPSRVRRHLLLMANVARTCRIARQGYDRVHVFNEERPEPQAALYWAKRALPSAKTFCVEDGLVEYRAAPMFSNTTAWGRLIFHSIYGWWWRPIPHRGGSRWADARLLSFPEAPPAVGAPRPIERLPQVCFERERFAAIAQAYGARIGFERLLPRGRYGLVLLTRSDRIRSRSHYGEMVRTVLRAASASGLGLALKHHPREPLADPFQAMGQPGVVDLPRGLSPEFLFAHPTAAPAFVIGDLTNTLVPARRLLPHALTLSVADLVGRHDPEVLPLLERIGVRVVDSFEELETALRNV
ncbi:MAG: hypothetical protein KDC27_18270 [Acidobacteria bacterium]|nr:hypothetical protein [Acidobacteriota bacterium]